MVSRHYGGVVGDLATQVEEGPLSRSADPYSLDDERVRPKPQAALYLHRDRGTAVALNSGYLSLERVKMLLPCCVRAKFRAGHVFFNRWQRSFSLSLFLQTPNILHALSSRWYFKPSPSVQELYSLMLQ